MYLLIYLFKTDTILLISVNIQGGNKMNYGFLGAGNMNGAIIKGMIKNGIDAKNIFVFDKITSVTANLKEECGINICLSQKELLEKDVIILGVKPQTLDIIASTIKDDIGDKKPLVISIAVGKTLSYLEENLGSNLPLVRVMPNINAKVLMSTSGYCTNSLLSPEQTEIVEKIFGSIGSVSAIAENMFSIFGVIAGSSPAFTYLYIDTLARSAQKAGMPKEQALKIAASTVLGSAKMVLEATDHPISLVDQVCSPGGTTIEGIASLKNNGFEGTLLKAFDAVLEKDKAIQRKK